MPQNAPWEYDPVVQPQSGGGGGAAWEGDPVVTPGVSEWRTFLDRQNRARNPGRTQQPGYSEMLDRMAMAYAQSGETPPRTGRMESFARGVSDTFSLGMDDELAGSVAGLRARVTGDDPERAAERARSSVRADRQVAREDNPATFFAGQATGGAQLAASGAGAVRAAAPGLARAAASRPLASGAGIGLVEGGGYGFGSAEGGAGERLDDAAVGAGIGTVAGVALPAAGQVTVNTMRGGRQLAREGIDAARTARQEVPAIDDLLDTTRQAYQAVDEAGVQY